jgi:hypothetical protein
MRLALDSAKRKTAQDRESGAVENSVWTMMMTMMALLIPQRSAFFNAEVAINHTHFGDGDGVLKDNSSI